MYERLEERGLAPAPAKKETKDKATDHDFGWRDFALYIAKFTHTPISIVIEFDIIEAHRWLFSIHRYIERERKEHERFEKELELKANSK